MLLLLHTNSEMFLVICELIDKLSRSLGGDHDSVDSMISDILNEIIVGVNKGSKATCKQPPQRMHAEMSPPL